MNAEPNVVSQLIRRSGRILLLWLVLSFAAILFITHFVPLTYEAFSLLEVEPAKAKLFGELQSDFGDIKETGPYLQTQVQLATSGRVLKEVLRDSAIQRIPLILESKDAEVDLRKRIDVRIIDQTFLIRVALKLPNAEHAAQIVNAVVDSYLKYGREIWLGKNASLMADLNEQLKMLESEIEENQKKRKALAEKETVEFSKPPHPSKDDADPAKPAFAAYAEDHVRKIIDQMINTDLELIEAQATLEARQAANRAAEERLKVGAVTSKSTEALSEARIRVAALIKTREKQAKLFERLTIAKKPGQNDSFYARFLNEEITSLLNKRRQIKTNVDELNFEARRDFSRVRLVDNATAPKLPSNTNMYKYAAAAPVAVLFVLIGLFWLVEIKASRQSRRIAADHRRDDARDAVDGEYVGFKPAVTPSSRTDVS
jgi:capsular polysaccharide biosynthesis protein